MGGLRRWEFSSRHFGRFRGADSILEGSLGLWEMVALGGGGQEGSDVLVLVIVKDFLEILKYGCCF